VLRVHQKKRDGTQIGGRLLIEEHGRVRSQPVHAVLLGEKAFNGQIIAKHARAFFARLRKPGDFRGVPGARANVGEDLEFDGRLERGRSLEAVECIENQQGIGLLVGEWRGHDFHMISATMMPVFSSRLQWNSQPNPLAVLLAEKRRAGAAVLDLTESNPTHAGLAYPDGEILAALADPGGLRYDPDPRGLTSAREAIAGYYAVRAVDVPVSRIVLTASTSEAYSFLFKLLADPGDEILVPQPSYPLFEYLARLEAVRVRPYALRYDGGWHIDLGMLEGLVTPRTKAIVVVNPNNPTGSYLKRDEWQRLQALGIPVLSDEVFADFAFSPDAARVPTLAGASEVLAFSMSGLSKVAGLPQMKLGWIVAGGPGHHEALEGLEWIADTYLSVSTPVQLALPRILAAATVMQQQILRRTRANLAHLRGAVGAASPFRVLEAEGGWYAVLQVPRTRSEEEWTLDLLAQRDVLVQPGFFYDFAGEAFLILSLLTPPEVFAEGVRRVIQG
jgi:alanine-synthesizing transaminase